MEARKILAVIAALGLAGAALADEPPAKGPMPVKEFTGKDLPAPEPGQGAWDAAPHGKWCFGVAICGPWVYAASGQTGYVLRFERDPATANLEYKGATAYERRTAEGENGCALHVRRPPDGKPILYLLYSNHKECSLYGYDVDDKTGSLALKGKFDAFADAQGEVSGGHGYPVWQWSPDQKRLYLVGVKKIVWWGFNEDGLPVQEGKVPCAHPGNAPEGVALFSPDGRHLYSMFVKPTPNGTAFYQVDAYDYDPETGGLTFNSTLDVPDTPLSDRNDQGGFQEFLDITPDGRQAYLLDQRASSYHVLARDVEKGTLSVLTSGTPDPSMRGVSGPHWSRGGKFAFSADGRTGYYLGNGTFGWFTRDPATGALTAYSSLRGTWARIELDAAEGNLFLVGGEKISSFLVPGAKKEAPPPDKETLDALRGKYGNQ